MLITASYINSRYDIKKTIELIDETDNIDSIHADLMDGNYVTDKNFTEEGLKEILGNVKKKIDVHLMVFNPEQYLETLFDLNTNIIFFHPKTTKNPKELIERIRDYGRIAGIVINPDEDIRIYNELYPLVEAVLIMSVYPGKGGQKFVRRSLVNYELVKEMRTKYGFRVYVDGGINDETIKFVKDSDGVIVGSYICQGTDYKKQVDNLLISLDMRN